MAEPKSSRHTTPRVVVSVPGILWDRFGKAVGTRNRSETVRAFIAWYMREPGAKLPERPPRQDPSG
jgi:hypothetical protein